MTRIRYEEDNSHGHHEWSKAIWQEVKAERTPDILDFDSISLEELERLTAPTPPPLPVGASL